MNELGAMICDINIYDSDSEVCLSVSHTVCEEILIRQYGKQALGISVDEAKALHRALGALLDQPGMANEQGVNGES